MTTTTGTQTRPSLSALLAPYRADGLAFAHATRLARPSQRVALAWWRKATVGGSQA